MAKDAWEGYVPFRERLRIREEKARALDSCYIDPDKIPQFLKEGLICPEQAREVRRHYLFNDTFSGDYPLELETALRRKDITYSEYCEGLKRYYLKFDLVEGESEGLLDFWEGYLDDWVRIWNEEWDNEFWPCELEPPRERKERPREFERIDYRSPHPLSEMRDDEIMAAARLFHRVETQFSGPRGITRPLEFIAELTLQGFKLPRYFNRVLQEYENHDEESDEPFMSKVRAKRFRNKVRRYAATFWFNLCINRLDVYEDFWKNKEKIPSLIVK